jgi:hypothetical protein
MLIEQCRIRETLDPTQKTPYEILLEGDNQRLRQENAYLERQISLSNPYYLAQKWNEVPHTQINMPTITLSICAGADIQIDSDSFPKEQWYSFAKNADKNIYSSRMYNNCGYFKTKRDTINAAYLMLEQVQRKYVEELRKAS